MSNRVNILIDSQNAAYNQDDPSLLQAVDFIHCFHYPNLTAGEKNNIAGFEGDPVFIQFPFRVQTNPVGGVIPVLSAVRVSVVAIKAGKTDFVVESKTFNTAAACLLNGVQQLAIVGTKGYVTYANDPYNSANLANTPSWSAGTYAGFTVQYGFVLRYDYWRNILTTSPGGANCSNDINNDIQTINNSWHTLTQNGWSLVLRIDIDVIGYDGHITTFEVQTAITVLAIGSPAQTDLQYTAQTIYYDSNNVVIPYIKQGAITRVRTIFTPNGFSAEAGPSYFGYYFADIVSSGGVNVRRFASSEIPSETGSPFSASTNIAGTTTQYANGGVRIGIFATGVIIIESLFDATTITWNQIGIAARIGFYTPGIDDESGEPIADETGSIIIDG